jgi:NAD(P)-dependent dehydrogenase (short-subunit alcohol dehydrogenase family)
MDITDRVVIITGAAGGVGNVVSKQFAAAGAKVALVDRAKDRLHEQCGAIEGALLVPGIDLTIPADTERMAQQVREHYGHIDVLINIAGGYRAGDPLHQTDVDTWDFMMNLNAKSVFLAAQAVIPHMIERGEGGRIISFAAKPGLSATKNHAAYSASKSAVVRLTETMALELKAHRINANCVVPKTIDTPANREAMPNADFEAWVTPSQLADVLQFLASGASTAVNGAAIPVYAYA